MYYIILNINLLLDYWWWTYILNLTNKYFFEFFKNEVTQMLVETTSVGEMVDILATLESEKWWIAVGVGEMVEFLATLESEKW